MDPKLVSSTYLVFLLIFLSTYLPINTFSASALEVRVETLDKIGLPNVTVVVKPSIYSLKEVRVNTDHNGLAVVSGFERSIDGTIYVELIINFYGLSVGLRSIDPSYGKITFTLPYVCINGSEVRVLDEYRSGFNGFYRLEFNGLILSYGEVIDGFLKLNHTRYPLLLKASDAIVISYGGSRNETRLWMEGLLKYRVGLYYDPGFNGEVFAFDLDAKTIVGGVVVVDLHPPKIISISLNRTSVVSCIQWFQARIEVNDGVNTPGVNLFNLKIFVPEAGRYVTPTIEKISVGDRTVFIAKFHVSSCIVKSVIIEELEVRDPYGRSTYARGLVFNTTIIESDVEENGVEGGESSSGVAQSETVVNKSVSHVGTGSSTWFTPVGGNGGHEFNLTYLLGFAISSGIILYEKLFRKKQIG